LPCCFGRKNWDSSKAWSWKSLKNGSGTNMRVQKSREIPSFRKFTK
jgi:hypothetical protein